MANETQGGSVCAAQVGSKSLVRNAAAEIGLERDAASAPPESQEFSRRYPAEREGKAEHESRAEREGRAEQTGEHPTAAQRRAEQAATRSGAAAQPTDHAQPMQPKNAEQERVRRVWQQWLGALATDSEAALAAALAYQQLDDRERECWLEAVDADAERIGVPPVAVYAPLLAVESDGKRRERIARSVSRAAQTDWERQGSPQRHRALWGAEGACRVAVLIGPLYLDFVQVIACSYRPGECFDWVRHDPIAKLEQVPRPGSRIGNCVVLETPLQAAIDELAVTVLAHRRTGRAFPEGLCALVDWFGPPR